MALQSDQKKLGVFSIVMITVGAVDSIRNLPASALLGSHLIVLYIIAAVLFFLPAAFVSAELASSESQLSGVYDWVSRAFGPLSGVLAVWFQWTENLFWYPTILAFIASTLGYLIAPTLATNKVFIAGVIMVSFWLVTIVNLLGIRASALFASFCTIAGLIIPMAVIIIMGGCWLWWHHSVQLTFTATSLLPNWHDSSMWSSLNAVILSLMGIEIATVHARSVRDPRRVYPVALCVSGLILILTLVLGSLAIAVTVPHNQINPLLGLMQVIKIFFTSYHIQAWIPYFIGLVVIGVVGSVNNWVIAPTSGLRYAAEQRYLPSIFAMSNRNQAPKFLLLMQAVIVSLISVIFIVLPSVSESYWFLTAMATQQYALMYLLMFATGIRQRYFSHDDHGYHIPGGNWVMWLLAGIGFMTMLFVIVIGFIPPVNNPVHGFIPYPWMVLLGMLLLVLPAFILYWLAKKGGVVASDV